MTDDAARRRAKAWWQQRGRGGLAGTGGSEGQPWRTGSSSTQTGPIDYLVVEFPGNRMTGEAFPLLVDLVDRGLIRIIDFVFVRKELDGSVDRA